MRFLLDESAEFRIAVFLLSLGHDVTAIGHDYPASLPDPEVLAIAVDERRILITNDSDFGRLIFQRHLPHAGVIFFRLKPDATAQEKIDRLSWVLPTYADRLDQFLVVTERTVRVRPTVHP